MFPNRMCLFHWGRGDCLEQFKYESLVRQKKGIGLMCIVVLATALGTNCTAAGSLLDAPGTCIQRISLAAFVSIV